MVGRSAQLALGVGCMVQVANVQYAWTLFDASIDQRFGWGRAAMQVAFSIFVVAETWLVPAEGWLIDRLGPRVVVPAGVFFVGLSWVLDSRASSPSLPMLGRSR